MNKTGIVGRDARKAQEKIRMQQMKYLNFFKRKNQANKITVENVYMEPIDILKTTKDPIARAKAAKDLIRQLIMETGCDFIYKIKKDSYTEEVDDYIGARMLKRFKSQKMPEKLKKFEILLMLIERVKTNEKRVTSYQSLTKDLPSSSITRKEMNILVELVEDAFPIDPHNLDFNLMRKKQKKKAPPKYKRIATQKFAMKSSRVK